MKRVQFKSTAICSELRGGEQDSSEVDPRLHQAGCFGSDPPKEATNAYVCRSKRA
jgi:hypothetical protein